MKPFKTYALYVAGKHADLLLFNVIVQGRRARGDGWRHQYCSIHATHAQGIMLTQLIMQSSKLRQCMVSIYSVMILSGVANSYSQWLHTSIFVRASEFCKFVDNSSCVHPRTLRPS